MVKLGGLPGRRGVARFASLRESLSDVTRVCGVVEVGKVARHARAASNAITVGPAKLRVVAIGARTWRHSVHAG